MYKSILFSASPRSQSADGFFSVLSHIELHEDGSVCYCSSVTSRPSRDFCENCYTICRWCDSCDCWCTCVRSNLSVLFDTCERKGLLVPRDIENEICFYVPRPIHDLNEKAIFPPSSEYFYDEDDWTLLYHISNRTLALAPGRNFFPDHSDFGYSCFYVPLDQNRFSQVLYNGDEVFVLTHFYQDEILDIEELDQLFLNGDINIDEKIDLEMLTLNGNEIEAIAKKKRLAKKQRKQALSKLHHDHSFSISQDRAIALHAKCAMRDGLCDDGFSFSRPEYLPREVSVPVYRPENSRDRRRKERIHLEMMAFEDHSKFKPLTRSFRNRQSEVVADENKYDDSVYAVPIETAPSKFNSKLLKEVKYFFNDVVLKMKKMLNGFSSILGSLNIDIVDFIVDLVCSLYLLYSADGLASAFASVHLFVSKYVSSHVSYIVASFMALFKKAAVAIKDVMFYHDESIHLESMTPSEFFDGLSKNVTLLFTSNFTKTLQSLIVVVLSLNVFDWKPTQNFLNSFGLHGVKPITSFPDMLVSSFDVLAKISKFFELIVCGQMTWEYFMSPNPVVTAMAKAQILKAESNALYVGLPVEGKREIHDWMKDAQATLKILTEASKKQTSLTQKGKELLLTKIELGKLVSDVASRLKAMRRIPPVALIIHSPPGVGKSGLINFVASIMCSVMRVPYNAGIIFSFNNSSDFLDAYDPSSTRIVHFSEAGKVKPEIAKMREDRVLEIMLSLVDSQPMEVNKSAVEDKGRSFFDPWLVIIDTNNESLNIPHIAVAPAAYKRRFLYLKPTVLPEFRKMNGKSCEIDGSKPTERRLMDKYEFDLYYYVAVNNTQVIPEPVYLVQKKGVDDLADALYDVFVAHFKKNSFFEEKLEGELNEGVYGTRVRMSKETLALKEKINEFEDKSDDGDFDEYDEFEFDNAVELVENVQTEVGSAIDEKNYDVHDRAEKQKVDRIKKIASFVNNQNFSKKVQSNVLSFGMECLIFYESCKNFLRTFAFLAKYYPVYLAVRHARVQASNQFVEYFLPFLLFPLFFLFSLVAVGKFMPSFGDWIYAKALLMFLCCFCIWMWFQISSHNFVRYQRVMSYETRLSNLIQHYWMNLKSLSGKRVVVENDEDELDLSITSDAQTAIYRSLAFMSLKIAGFISIAYGAYRFVKKVSSVVPESGVNETFQPAVEKPVPINGKIDSWNYVQKDFKLKSTSNFSDFHNQISQNVRFVRVSSEGDPTQNIHALGVYGTVAVVPAHIFTNRTNKEILIEFFMGYRGEKLIGNTRLHFSEIAFVAPDVAVITCGSHIKFKDIRDHIVAEQFPIGGLAEGEINGYKTKFSHRKGPFGDAKFYQIPSAILYSWPDHKDGNCGLPLIAKFGNKLGIIGIHVGSVSFGSMAVPISRGVLVPIRLESEVLFEPVSGGDMPETVQELNHKSPFKYEDFDLLHFGSLPGNVNIPKSSHLVHTSIHEDVEEIFDNHFGEAKTKFSKPVMKPFLNKNGEWISPYNKGLRKMKKNRPAVPRSLLRRVVKILSEHLLQRLLEEGVTSLRPYDILHAINGDPNHPSFTRMRTTTSAGFGWKGSKGEHMPIVEEKDEYFGVRREPTPELQERVDQLINCWKNSRTSQTVYRVALKDEPRSIEKCQSGSTRLFYVQQLEMVIAMRMYLGPLLSLFPSYPHVFNCSVGIDMHMESDLLFKKLTSMKGFVGDFDYEGYDVSLPPDLAWAMMSVVINLLKGLGYGDDDIDIVRGLATDIMHPVIALLNELLLIPGLQPSGMYGTAELNSLKNTIMLMLFWYSHPVLAYEDFFSKLFHRTYGDDIIYKISEDLADHFNNITYSSFCKERLNVVVTTASKTSDMPRFSTEEDISFLKRKFVHRADLDRFVAQLDIDSIRKSLLFSLPSDNVSRLEQEFSSLRSALWEIFFHCPNEKSFDSLKYDLFTRFVERNLKGESEDFISDLKSRLPLWTELSEKFHSVNIPHSVV